MSVFLHWKVNKASTRWQNLYGFECSRKKKLHQVILPVSVIWPRTEKQDKPGKKRNVVYARLLFAAYYRGIARNSTSLSLSLNAQKLRDTAMHLNSSFLNFLVRLSNLFY